MVQVPNVNTSRSKAVIWPEVPKPLYTASLRIAGGTLHLLWQVHTLLFRVLYTRMLVYILICPCRLDPKDWVGVRRIMFFVCLMEWYSTRPLEGRCCLIGLNELCSLPSDLGISFLKFVHQNMSSWSFYNNLHIYRYLCTSSHSCSSKASITTKILFFYFLSVDLCSVKVSTLWKHPGNFVAHMQTTHLMGKKKIDAWRQNLHHSSCVRTIIAHGKMKHGISLPQDLNKYWQMQATSLTGTKKLFKSLLQT